MLFPQAVGMNMSDALFVLISNDHIATLLLKDYNNNVFVNLCL